MRPLATSTLTIALLLAACGADEVAQTTSTESQTASSVPVTSAQAPIPQPVPTPAPSPTPEPTSSDPVLADLLSISTWKGVFHPRDTYAKASLISHDGELFFAFEDHSSHGVTPDADPDHFERLDLIPSQRLLLSDGFANRGGPLNGRAVGPLQWIVSGQGAGTAIVDAARRYATADGNAYFMLHDIPGQVSEFTVYYYRDAPPGTDTVATTALSTNNFAGSGIIMWHANWSSRGVGNVAIWKDGLASLDPQNRFLWRSTAKITPGKRFQLTVRPRGTFAFGYVDGDLAFVTIADDNRIASEAKAFYMQNHVAVLGAEQHRYIELFVAE